MNLLINQDRPADQKYNKPYHVIDEQWTRLTACDMRTALVNEKLEKTDPTGRMLKPKSGQDRQTDSWTDILLGSVLIHICLSPCHSERDDYGHMITRK